MLTHPLLNYFRNTFSFGLAVNIKAEEAKTPEFFTNFRVFDRSINGHIGLEMTILQSHFQYRLFYNSVIHFFLFTSVAFKFRWILSLRMYYHCAFTNDTTKTYKLEASYNFYSRSGSGIPHTHGNIYSTWPDWFDTLWWDNNSNDKNNNFILLIRWFEVSDQASE